jgi:hypothetical protein
MKKILLFATAVLLLFACDSSSDNKQYTSSNTAIPDSKQDTSSNTTIVDNKQYASSNTAIPDNINGEWLVSQFGGGYELINSYNYIIRISQNGSSVQFQSQRKDLQWITWSGQYSAGRLNAEANYIRIGGDLKYSVSLTMIGNITPDGRIDTQVYEKVGVYDMTGNIPNIPDGEVKTYHIIMDRIK